MQHKANRVKWLMLPIHLYYLPRFWQKFFASQRKYPNAATAHEEREYYKTLGLYDEDSAYCEYVQDIVEREIYYYMMPDSVLERVYLESIIDIDFYCKMPMWNIKDAILLSLDKTLCTTELIWLNEYEKRRQLLIKTIECGDLDVKKEKSEKTNEDDEYQFRPLDFINWAKKKGIKLPQELGELVKKYNISNDIDWEEKCVDLESRLQELEAKNLKLTQEANSAPNARRLTSWKKGFIGMLAIKYTSDRLLKNFGNNQTITNKTNIEDRTKLTYSQIRNDMDLQGVAIDDGTIKELIQDSIDHLYPKSGK